MTLQKTKKKKQKNKKILVLLSKMGDYVGVAWLGLWDYHPMVWLSTLGYFCVLSYLWVLKNWKLWVWTEDISYFFKSSVNICLQNIYYLLILKTYKKKLLKQLTVFTVLKRKSRIVGLGGSLCMNAWSLQGTWCPSL